MGDRLTWPSESCTKPRPAETTLQGQSIWGDDPMNGARLGSVLRHIHRLALPAQTQDLSAAQLLGRFRAGRDEAAFAALMQRHGSLVWCVCRHVLGHEQDVED